MVTERWFASRSVSRRGPSARALYEQCGWSVIPVDGDTKKPLVPWRVYTTRRPGLDEVFAWASRFRGSGIAVITGPVSRILVLDADGVSGVAEATKNGVPKTPTVRTPRGGAHYYFRLDDGDVVRNGAKLGQSKALDIRGKAGYVVAPYTSRSDGRRYEWVHSPENTPIAEPPEWLQVLLQQCAIPHEEKSGVRLCCTHDISHVLIRLSPYHRQLVEDGHDLSRYPSRSECDTAVVLALLAAGADDALIEEVFDSYPIGEKFHESGSSYLNKTIEYALRYVRTVTVKYADPIQYYDSGSMRIQLALTCEEDGSFLRTGVSMPVDNSSEAMLERWRRFFSAVDLTVPETFEEMSRTCKSIVGKRFRITLRKGGDNPVSSFHRL